MNIDKVALKKIVDEIEASRARQRGETEHQREVMKRAKDHQLDAKAIRIVLQRRAMGDVKRDEQDYYVHAYEMALGGKKDAIEALERGASVREAARAGGISTGAAGNLARGVQKSSFVDTPDEMTADDLGQHETTNREADASAVAAGRLSEPSDPAAQAVNPDLPLGRVSPDILNGHGAQPGTNSNAAPQAAGAPEAPRAHATPQPAPDGGVGTGTIEPGSAHVAAETERPAPAPESCGEASAGALVGTGCDRQSAAHETQQGVATPGNSKERPAGNVAKPQERTATAVRSSHLPERPSHSAGLVPGPQDDLAFPVFLKRAAA